MKFIETEIQDLFIIELEKISDERGFFARSFCEKEFARQGLCSRFVQCNFSFNHQSGTVRGMHFQLAPNEETKLVCCTRGKIFDLVIDLRKNSKTYMKSVGCELSEENGKMFYIPKGLAHGFQTLENDTQVFYQMSDFFVPESASGIRYNDPCFSIQWPKPISVISKKDETYPDYHP